MAAPFPNRTTQDHADAKRWARSLLARRDWVILDTETTGVDPTAEVIQLGILAPDGTVLLDTLVRPQGRTSRQAMDVHGISEARTASAPPYPDVHDLLVKTIAGKEVVCYNAEFDRRLLDQTARRYGLTVPAHRWHCAMLEYARYVGDWDDDHGDYRWQKLPPIPGNAAHEAVADCVATLAVLQGMGAENETASPELAPEGEREEAGARSAQRAAGPPQPAAAPALPPAAVGPLGRQRSGMRRLLGGLVRRLRGLVSVVGG
jgi:DNA polymerase-3 subunit epsilon